jgi:hypothetical protein
MDWLSVSSAVLNLAGSVLLGWDLVLAPRRLRQEAGSEKLRDFVDQYMKGVELFVAVGDGLAPFKKDSWFRAVAIRRRGQFGMSLLVIGFLLQLVAALLGSAQPRGG